MVVRKPATTPTQRRANHAPATRTRRTAAPAAQAEAKDVTVYAEKEPTDYHKAFARWLVSEVGYDPKAAGSLMKAFLMGVSLATVARPAFMDSDFLEEWREKTGTAKRGPKPKDAEEVEEEAPMRRTRKAKAAPEPEPEPEDDEDEYDD